MVRSLILVWAAPAIMLSAPAGAQSATAAPKPVPRAEFVKKVDTQFGALDANHDGSLSAAEVQAAERSALQQGKTRIAQQLQAKFKQLDTNKDGQLSLAEFMAAAPTVQSSETPQQVLQKLDANHDGKVTADEFRAPQLAAFARLDANHDGVVTPAEAAAARK